MMDIDNKNWTPKVLAAWREVGEVAKSKGHRITNIYHLLLCLWNNSNSSFEMFLENSGISLRPKNINELLDKLAKKKAHLFFDKNSEPIIEKSIQKCLKSSIGLGKKFNNVFIGVEHFIWGILDSDPEFCDFLLENGIDTEHLKLCIEAFIRGEMVNDEEEMDEEEYFDDDEGVKESEVRKENSQLKSSQLKRFCILVNEVVKAPEFGIISGRESEITNLEEILCCKTKSNCILIGEAGTGKTSVVEGLAQFISSEG
jgi:ATP-dependent Clp protease ATP-binding subunit ClpA